MHRFPRAVPAVLVAATIAACRLDVGDSTTAQLPSDTEIAAALYAGAPRTPAGFAADPVPPSYQQVTTYHVKSTQVDPSTAATFELCTDEWTEALAWSEALAQQAEPYLDLVANEETERYFELDRVPMGQPERYVRMRVYRCAYLDRAGVDLNADGGFAGTFNRRPLDATALRELSEYLWLFTTYNNADHAALASFARPVANGLAHVITIATLERGTMATACDRVFLSEWQHTVDLTTRALTLTTTPRRDFSVRNDNGIIVGC